MKNIVELFEKQFMLTGSNTDPKDLDFTFYTQEKITFNQDGTPAVKRYFMNYDQATGVFSNLAVRCVYTYTYNGQGVLTKRVEDIDWYFEDDTIGTSRKVRQVYETV